MNLSNLSIAREKIKKSSFDFRLHSESIEKSNKIYRDKSIELKKKITKAIGNTKCFEEYLDNIKNL